MTIPTKLVLRAKWRQRHETPEQVSRRLNELFDVFGEIGGPFAAPFFSLENSPYAVSGDRAALDSMILAGRDYDSELDRVNEVSGIHIAATQQPMPGDGPCIDINLHAGGAAGGMRGSIANSLVIVFDRGSSLNPIAARFLADVLKNGTFLIEQLVRIWDPDAASLDSLELMRAQKVPGSTRATIGFVTWVSDEAINGDVSRLLAFKRLRLEDGWLFAVNLSSENLLEEGLELVKLTLRSGLLHELPVTYGSRVEPR